MQVFEHTYDKHWQSVGEATQLFQTRRFALLQPNFFITLLSAAPILTPTGLDLTATDFIMFKQLRAGRSKFEEAMKLFRKRKQPAEGGEGGE